MSDLTINSMTAREGRYLQSFPYREGPRAEAVRTDLRERYEAAGSSAEELQLELQQFAQARGVDLTRAPAALRGQPFDAHEVKEAARGVVHQLFGNPEACCDPAKAAVVGAETETFVGLLDQARQAGTLGNFGSEDAYRLVSSNLTALALQDRASSETILGDHGVRHVVAHNIAVCDELAGGLQVNGAELGADAQLLLHQAMLWHDVGYAMQPVRERINTEGPRGQDAGHALLGARAIRERAEDPSDPLRRIFRPEQLDLLHRLVLFHDVDAQGKPGIDLSIPGNRGQTLESIMRLADNSHAFEDKLPQVLYQHPEAFQTLRLLVIAQELGQSDQVQALLARLRQQVEGGAGRDEREALALAAGQLNSAAVPFAVARIGASPGHIQVTGPGQVLMVFAETPDQRDLQELYGQTPGNQLGRVVKDLTGAELPAQGNARVETPGLTVQVRRDPCAPQTPFQQQLADSLRHPAFWEWAVQDAQLAGREAHLRKAQACWAGLTEEERVTELALYPGGPEAQLDDIRRQRAELLQGCLEATEV